MPTKFDTFTSIIYVYFPPPCHTQKRVCTSDATPFHFTFSYLTWETYRVIYKELYQGLGLCLGAVLILTLILIAHPLTALLVFFCVTITIVDVLGIM